MTSDPLRESALLKTLPELIGDAADLFQKELRLAKAEVAANVTQKLQAGVWMAAAVGCGFFAVLFVLQAVVLGLSVAGLPPHWGSLLVALVLAGIGIALFYKGKADAAKSIVPRRALNQIQEDIKTTKEQLS
jgi:hypothetical protein